MTSVDERATAGDEVRSVSAERLTFFSDAVVAILPVPEGRGNAEALHSLREHTNGYLSFLISFVVIAGHWFGHHRVFAHVTSLGGRLIRWNTLWLLTIVLIPFATRTLTGDGAFQVRFIMYALVQAFAGLFFLMMLRTVTRYGLLEADTPPEVIRTSYARIFVMTGAFLLSIPVSFLTHWAYVCWAAIPLAVRGFLLLGSRRAARREAAAR